MVKEGCLWPQGQEASLRGADKVAPDKETLTMSAAPCPIGVSVSTANLDHCGSPYKLPLLRYSLRHATNDSRPPQSIIKPLKSADPSFCNRTNP